jgi:hypothetical protein
LSDPSSSPAHSTWELTGALRPTEAGAGTGAARGGVACGGRGRLGVAVVDHGAPDVLAEQLAGVGVEQGDRQQRGRRPGIPTGGG